jgi:hypothetical protein
MPTNNGGSLNPSSLNPSGEPLQLQPTKHGLKDANVATHVDVIEEFSISSTYKVSHWGAS